MKPFVSWNGVKSKGSYLNTSCSQIHGISGAESQMFTDTVRALASDAAVPGRKLGGATLAAWGVRCPCDGSLKKAEHYFRFLPFFHKSKSRPQIFFG